MPNLTEFFRTILRLEEGVKEDVRSRIVKSFGIKQLIQSPLVATMAVQTAVELLMKPIYELAEAVGVDFAKTIAKGEVTHTPGSSVAKALDQFRLIAFGVRRKFAMELDTLIQQQTQAGVSREGLIQNLSTGLRDQHPVFSSFTNGLAFAAVASIQLAATIATQQSIVDTDGQPNEDDNEWIWVTVEDNRVCEDCGPRHDTIQTLAKWKEMGTPRSGWSVCTDRCRCVILPAQFANANIDMSSPVKLTKADEAKFGTVPGR